MSQTPARSTHAETGFPRLAGHPRRRRTPLEWIRVVRERGLLASCKPADTKVLMMLFAHANAQRVAAPGVTVLSAETGLKSRSVIEARRRLSDLGLIREVPPCTPSRAKHYRLTLPAPPRAAERADGWESRFGGSEPCTAVHPASPCTLHADAPYPCTAVHPTPAPPCTLRGKQEARKKRQQERAPGDGDGAPGLFAGGPPFDAAAAAALRVWGGFAQRQAHGWVTEYRPTRRQVLNVLANAFALRRDGRLTNFAGFVRSQIRQGAYTPDDRVLIYRRQRRQRAKAAASRRQEAQRPAEPPMTPEQRREALAAFKASLEART